MKLVLIAIWFIVLLLSGCAQTGSKVAENAVSEAQATDAAATEQTLLEQARIFRKANPELFGDTGGVLITGLEPGGQAEKIGLMPGDILLSYDGTPLETMDHLIPYKKDIQTSVTLTYLRGEAKRETVLQGGKIGIHIASLIPGPAEQIDQIIEKGGAAYYQSRFQEALQLFQQALNLSRENGYRNGEANSLNNLGNAHISLNQYSQALENYEASLKIMQEIGDRGAKQQALTGWVMRITH